MKTITYQREIVRPTDFMDQTEMGERKTQIAVENVYGVCVVDVFKLVEGMYILQFKN